MAAEKRLRIATERLAITRAFGTKVRERRVARHESINRLAERCGLSPSLLSTVEHGRHEPRLALLLIICDGLKLTPNELLAGLPTPKEQR